MSGNCFAGLRAEVRLTGAFFLAAVVTRVVCFNGGFVVAAVFALGFAVRDFVLVSGFFFAAAGTAAGFTAFFTAGFLGIAFRVVFVALGLAIGLGAFLATTAFAFGFAATGLIFDVGVFFSAAGTVAAFTVCFLAGNFFGSALAAGFLMPFLAEGLAVGFPTFLLAAATLGFSTFLADVLFGAAGFVVTEVVRFFPADFFVAGCFMAGFEALATGFVLEAVFFFWITFLAVAGIGFFFADFITHESSNFSRGEQSPPLWLQTSQKPRPAAMINASLGRSI